jgi:hypothetical protein
MRDFWQEAEQLRGEKAGIEVPYFAIEENLDGIEALLSVDRELAKDHAIFARPYFDFEGAPTPTNSVLVRAVAPGFRIRIGIDIVWKPGASRKNIYLLCGDELLNTLNVGRGGR